MSRTARTTLAAAPRVPLGHWPTPLEPCHRLRDELGRGPLVWLKRDDCSGLALGGNKTRKLEYLLGQAVADGCTGAITFGALQSNHARQTAAACNRAGLTCDLILTRAVDRSDDHYLRSGNLLIDHLLGATVHAVDDPDAAFVRFAELFEAAGAEGRQLYAIGPGGSDAVGSLGYVSASLELAEQLADRQVQPSRVVVATSTAGTAAGLAVGLHLAEVPAAIDVECVYHDAAATAAELAPLIEATAIRLGTAAPPQRWAVDDAALGDGYGIPSPAGQDAIDLLARTEGVLLDPVYTAKAFGHLLTRIRAGELDDETDVVFIHTGGAPGLFAYAPEWPTPDPGASDRAST
jgi:D-cysteine desulfhydrase family pyridoxal phosphate-dependent enzyme